MLAELGIARSNLFWLFKPNQTCHKIINVDMYTYFYWKMCKNNSSNQINYFLSFSNVYNPIVISVKYRITVSQCKCCFSQSIVFLL